MKNVAGFHDSTLLAIERGEHQSVLSFENVDVNGELRNVQIVLANVSRVIGDGNSISALEMKYKATCDSVTVKIGDLTSPPNG